jgi:hypothetical protein
MLFGGREGEQERRSFLQVLGVAHFFITLGCSFFMYSFDESLGKTSPSCKPALPMSQHDANQLWNTEPT